MEVISSFDVALYWDTRDSCYLAFRAKHNVYQQERMSNILLALGGVAGADTYQCVPLRLRILKVLVCVREPQVCLPLPPFVVERDKEIWYLLGISR